METTIDRVARRESPGDVTQTPHYSRDRVAVAVDMVRRATGGIPATRGKSAVLATCAMIESHGVADPRDVLARSAHLSIPTDGTMAPFGAAPDPWEARNHKSRVTRSKKRGASFKVDRVGAAPVIGDCYQVVAPYADESLTLAERDHVSADLVAYLHDDRMRLGARGLMVQLITDRHYRDHGLERLIGTESGKSWQMALSRRIDRSDVPTGDASKHLSGWLHLADADEIAAHASIWHTRTRRTITVRKHSPRHHVPAVSYRDSEPRPTRINGQHPFTYDAECLPLTLCDAPSHDNTRGYWHGHTFTPRGPLAYDRTAETVTYDHETLVPIDHPARHIGRWNAAATCWDAVQIMPHRVGHRVTVAPRTVTLSRTDARTINTGGEPIACDTPAAIATAVECMNRDERVVLKVAGTTVTVTRGKGQAGVWSIRPAGGKSIGGLRTPANVGERAMLAATAS